MPVPTAAQRAYPRTDFKTTKPGKSRQNEKLKPGWETGSRLVGRDAPRHPAAGEITACRHIPISCSERSAPREATRALHFAADGVKRVDDSPIWHGEMDVLERYATSRQDRWHRLRLYSTAEPCSMCLAAILWAGVPEVVYGTSIATLRELGWQQFSLSSDELLAGAPFANCHIMGGVLADQCDALFRKAKG